ncbi:TetR/AcrR family transcriptional regulator [Streptomyces rapamycinicus]|uniref:TetR family transcriptional regulator n=2 Tax=Streptomyces rapamycinicus TaxID=1226757 RepID=A0A0A0NGH5_STRRN|nr:TetR/AcrR family transcriptional regulator [Streptomyces rapamycinicus]AGP58667.1 TetR family transcriptional regulator [Streptomyces rapamycinicus NRRL 5491]MBB4786380.1 AcrR family transcriptional regulator [Streptomyces rapamycinicus]RLV78160.1 TetR family transcriptional regulator [Streptomyces rapamycinicus NRRL 5491]UTO66477.1 TetR/AcrR family transcriptional regulator [Streptomyces rapamycinicus]UTP34431.1 TetR/AcrR family transcriptional regulator [Streptomyces rapamycinicus NRRL 54
MSAIKERRERERAQRHQLIITAARELAEAEGWEAVTTRRLAERVEYSQPVLYSHFSGKDAIVRAVSIDGFGELAAHLRRARLAAPEPGQALHAVCRAYLEFATERPALYQAMFVMPTDVKFAHVDTPPQLRAGFDEFVSCYRPDNARRQLFAEVIWSALHGIAVLSDSGRIPPDTQDERLDFLITQLADTPS